MDAENPADIPPEVREAGDATFEIAAPLIWDAVQAQRAHDQRRVASAIQQLMHIGEASFYGSLSVFAAMAVEGVPHGLVPGATWRPQLMIGNPPRPVDPDADPAAGFAMRLLAGTVNRDEDFKLAVWKAFVQHVAEGPGADEERARQAATAFVLLVQLAARGADRAEGREARKHQHPNAPRATRAHHPRRGTR